MPAVPVRKVLRLLVPRDPPGPWGNKHQSDDDPDSDDDDDDDDDQWEFAGIGNDWDDDYISKGGIAGLVVGIVAFIAIGMLACWFFRRRKARKVTQDSHHKLEHYEMSKPPGSSGSLTTTDTTTPIAGASAGAAAAAAGPRQHQPEAMDVPPPPYEPPPPVHVAKHEQAAVHHGRYHTDVSDISEFDSDAGHLHPTITDGNSGGRPSRQAAAGPSGPAGFI